MFKLATDRNIGIFCRHNYWLLSMYVFMTILLVIERVLSQSYTEVFKGILQIEGSIFVPFVWITIILIPFLAIGGTVRMLVKEQYAHLHKIPLVTYVLSIVFILVVMTSLFWIIPIVILQPVNNWVFSISGLVYLILLVLIYALMTIYMKPIYVFEILCGLVMMCVSYNDFPVLSQLMEVRFNFSLQQVVLDYGILTCIIVILIFNIHKIDFLTD